MPTISLPRRTRIACRTSVVQLEYFDKKGPSPKPGANWTRFVLLSDTHTCTFPVPDGDVLLHSGDLTQMGTLKELETTMEWLYALPHPVKIVIAGNHDYSLHHDWYAENWGELKMHRGYDEPESAQSIRELLLGPRAVEANIFYLQNEEHKFTVREGGKEWSVYGSPYTPIPIPGEWAFGYKAVDGEALTSKFPKTDILLTHGPPQDVLDYTIRKDRAGCPALSTRIQELKPRLHVFGHIHEARGAYMHFWSPDAGKPMAQNAIQLEDSARIKETFWTRTKSKAKQLVEQLGISRQSLEGTVAENSAEQTLFVNAANWPAGPRTWKNGVRFKVGVTTGFQPVIVDLME